jgi:hypothetical protein
VISAGLLVFYYFFRDLTWLVWLALVINLIGAFLPKLAGYLSWAWYKLAEGMGFVMSKVILSLVFFIFLFPLAWLSKLFTRKDFLRKRDSVTTYLDKNHTYSSDDLEKMW